LLKLSNLVDKAIGVTSGDFRQLVKRVSALLEKEEGQIGLIHVEGRLIQLQPVGNATIIGDLHGDLESLTYILEHSGFLKEAQEEKNVYLIFLGDYGDRGSSSSEVYYIVLKLKELFPEKVILIRGNHEGPEDMLPFPHNLPVQLEEKYGTKGFKIYNELQKLFNNLYCAALVNERFVLIHGGFPSQATSLNDLALAYTKHPQESHLQEMLWSDPIDDFSRVHETEPSPRGAGRLFGIAVTERMLKMLGVKVLIRGHESCEGGYKINHNDKVLTLFSTNKPPYQNKKRTYLQLNLTKKIENTKQLEKYIQQF
jgi:protein phosphatase